MTDQIELTLLDPEGRSSLFRFDGMTLELSGYYVPPDLPTARFSAQGLKLTVEKPNRKGHVYIFFLSAGFAQLCSGPIAPADLPRLEPLLSALESAGAQIKRK